MATVMSQPFARPKLRPGPFRIYLPIAKTDAWNAFADWVTKFYQ